MEFSKKVFILHRYFTEFSLYSRDIRFSVFYVPIHRENGVSINSFSCAFFDPFLELVSSFDEEKAFSRILSRSSYTSNVFSYIRIVLKFR